MPALSKKAKHATPPTAVTQDLQVLIMWAGQTFPFLVDAQSGNMRDIISTMRLENIDLRASSDGTPSTSTSP